MSTVPPARTLMVLALLSMPGQAAAGAVCQDLWLSPSCGSGSCSHHGGVWAWCGCPGMEGHENYIEECPVGVPAQSIAPSGGTGLNELISEHPGILTPCAQFDDQSRGLCRAAIVIGGATLALGLHSLSSSSTEECQIALTYANQQMRSRYREGKSQLPMLESERDEQQELLKTSSDTSGFKDSPYRSLLAEILRDDLRISTEEASHFDKEFPDVDGGAVASYRLHRGSPFFDQMLEVFRVDAEFRQLRADMDTIATIFPLNTTEAAAEDLARSGACDIWVQLYEQRGE
jgi:hypothetical protein